MLEKIKNDDRKFLVELYAGTGRIFGSFKDADWFGIKAGDSFAKVVEAYYRGKPHDPLTLRPLDPRSFDPRGLTRMPYTGPDQLRPGILVEVPSEGVVRVTRVGRSHNRFYYDTISPKDFRGNNYGLRHITAVYDSPRVLSARNGQEADCPICVEALVDDPVHGQVIACETGPQVAGKIVCGHKFHRFCIQDWFTQTAAPRKCPMCNALVTGLWFANPEVPVAAAAAGGAGGGGSSGGARTRRNRNRSKNNRKSQSRKHRRSSHRSRKH